MECIAGLNVPTGIPLLYELTEDLQPTVPGGRYLDPDTAANVLVEMEPTMAANVIVNMEPPEASMVLAAMDPDDRVDILAHVPRERHNQLIGEMTAAQAQETSPDRS